MKRTWQRELEAQMYRDSQQPCTCENNGDLCVSCEAVDYLQSLAPKAAKPMVICVWLNVANDIRSNRVYSTYVSDLYRTACPFQDAVPCWSR